MKEEKEQENKTNVFLNERKIWLLLKKMQNPKVFKAHVQTIPRSRKDRRIN